MEIKKILLSAIVFSTVLVSRADSKDKFVGNWIWYMNAEGKKFTLGNTPLGVKISKDENTYQVAVDVIVIGNSTAQDPSQRMLENINSQSSNFNLQSKKENLSGAYTLSDDGKSLASIDGHTKIKYLTQGNMLQIADLGLLKRGTFKNKGSGNGAGETSGKKELYNDTIVLNPGDVKVIDLKIDKASNVEAGIQFLGGAENGISSQLASVKDIENFKKTGKRSNAPVCENFEKENIEEPTSMNCFFKPGDYKMMFGVWKHTLAGPVTFHLRVALKD